MSYRHYSIYPIPGHHTLLRLLQYYRHTLSTYRKDLVLRHYTQHRGNYTSDGYSRTEKYYTPYWHDAVERDYMLDYSYIVQHVILLPALCHMV